jgi:hypothetical protein
MDDPLAKIIKELFHFGSIISSFKPVMANPRPLKLSNVALLQSPKNPNFGPQNDDFSKMWPSSRFGLAMADLNPSPPSKFEA